jgi:hypothetical protein
MLCPTSGSLTSDGGVICSSHRDLLFTTKDTKVHKGLPLRSLVKNKKLAQTRGENLIHAVPPDLYLGISLKPLTEPSVQLTCQRRSVSRSRVVFGDFPGKRLSIFDLFSLSGM